MALTWKGDELKRRITRAAKEGIDSTMALAVIHAKQHHPWVNRTGTLEGSINIYQHAQEKGEGTVSGLWGSADVMYAIFLELGTSRMSPFPYLRPAADAEYPKLAALIQRAFARH